MEQQQASVPWLCHFWFSVWARLWWRLEFDTELNSWWWLCLRHSPSLYILGFQMQCVKQHVVATLSLMQYWMKFSPRSRSSMRHGIPPWKALNLAKLFLQILRQTQLGCLVAHSLRQVTNQLSELITNFHKTAWWCMSKLQSAFHRRYVFSGVVISRISPSVFAMIMTDLPLPCNINSLLLVWFKCSQSADPRNLFISFA